MKEVLISFETAQVAFEKGLRRKGEIFSENKVLKINLDGISCNNCFNLEGKEITPKYVLNKNHFPRPSQALLQKWLREVHGVLLQVYLHPFSSSHSWTYSYLQYDKGKLILEGNGNTIGKHCSYEEALEIGLQEVLKLI